MAEYVTDPVAAHAIVREAGTHADDASLEATKFTGATEDLLGAITNGWIVGPLGAWLGNMGSAMSVALTRADNAVGAGHEVIDTLEAADVAMANQQHDVVNTQVTTAGIQIDKGLSK